MQTESSGIRGSTRRGRRRPFAVSTLLALAALAVLIGTWLPGGGDPASAPLRIAINPWPGYEFAMLAASQGYFEDEGVDVRLVELSSLGDCRRAFERHQVDGMFGTLVEVLMAERVHGHRVEVVLAADYSDGADALLASRDIPDIASLRGKRIGAEPGTLTEVMLSLALRRAGLELSDVNVRWMPALDMPRAFKRGRIDAAVCYPPISVAIEEAGGHAIFDSSEIPGVILDVLAFDPAVVEARAAELEAFKRAYFRAQRFAEDHPDEAYAIMARRQGITKDDFEAAITGGIRLLTEEDQGSFLGATGRLDEIRATVAREMIRRKSRAITSVPTGTGDGEGP